MPQKPERIRRDEAALILGITSRSVIHLASSGQIPGAAKIGRTWTFDEARLRAWVKAQEERHERRAERGQSKATVSVVRFGRQRTAIISDRDDAYENMLKRLRRGGQDPKGKGRET